MKKILFLIFLSCLCRSLMAQGSTKSDSEQESLQVVKEFLTAYMKGDHEKFSSLIHPDIIWIQPGDNRIAGIKKSKAELLQMGAKMFELSAGTIKLVDVQYFGTNGNTVVCILHWKGAQPPGAVLDVKNIDTYTVEHGKVVMVKIFSNDIEQENRFWGKR